MVLFCPLKSAATEEPVEVRIGFTSPESEIALVEAVLLGETVELAVDHRRLYFFDRETGRALHVEKAKRPEPINH